MSMESSQDLSKEGVGCEPRAACVKDRVKGPVLRSDIIVMCPGTAADLQRLSNPAKLSLPW